MPSWDTGESHVKVEMPQYKTWEAKKSDRGATGRKQGQKGAMLINNGKEKLT